MTIFSGFIEMPLRSGLYRSRSLQRMVFYNIGADELDWNWERSVDGGESGASAVADSLDAKMVRWLNRRARVRAASPGAEWPWFPARGIFSDRSAVGRLCARSSRAGLCGGGPSGWWRRRATGWR